MVLESLTSVNEVQKQPAYLFVVSFIVSVVGVLMAYNTFPQSSSVLAISFASLALMPFIHSLFKREESKIALDQTTKRFLAENFEVVRVYAWLFVGMVFAYVFMGVFFPESNENCSGLSCMIPVKKFFFAEQKFVYSSITGNVIAEKECFNENTKSFDACFELIFKNNMWVMVMALIFSLVWGAGALFLLGWNASVIGLFIATEINSHSFEAGVARAISYLPHGIPEITAYFLAAIAGGIISAAISKSRFKPHEVRTIILDAGLLVLLATIALAIGALVEVAAIFGDFGLALFFVIVFTLLCLLLYVFFTK
ncbi:MAG: stage II sporulation protein M [Candidatus Diapherotrites archaeon]